ncbi:MAG: hypothetical protein EOP06_00160 [Proteobacteria bacterium]|nr:MAG: hypothetical protein EOP06_00160 [Pseudomonadota bacterium]
MTNAVDKLKVFLRILILMPFDFIEKNKLRSRMLLIKEHERLEAAELVGGFGSWEMDTSTWEVRWSKGLYAILECDPLKTQPDARLFTSLVAPTDLARLNDAYEAALTDRKIFDQEVTLHLAGGKTKIVRTRGTIKSSDDGGKVMIGTLCDKTELARERQRVQAAELVKARLAALTALIATYKHEINNPLTIALVSIESMRSQVVGDRAESILADAERALWRIAGVTKKMDVLAEDGRFHFSSYAGVKDGMIATDSEE